MPHTFPVTVSIATLPDRVDLLRQTIASLAKQVDYINLYLDGHLFRPLSALSDGPEYRFMFAREDSRRRGDAGKFFWAEITNGYHFTCDDDLVYPPDYVERMVTAIERYDRRACVGVLGKRFFGKWKSYYMIPTHDWHDDQKIHRVYATDWACPHDWWCHGLGTGTLAYHTDTIDLCASDFRLPNMADIWFALAAHRQNVPCVAIARPEGWIKILTPPAGTTIWDAWHESRDDRAQTEAIKAVSWPMPPWSVLPR